MTNPFLQKLMIGANLTIEDLKELETAISPPYKIGAGKDIIVQGDRPENVNVILGGLACRYKMLPNGQRQIMALLIPGDCCDLHVAVLDSMDHCIGTLTQTTVAKISRRVIEQLLLNVRIARALWWATLVDEATLREWVVNMGQRTAAKRMAHLFCELFARLQAIDLVDGKSFNLGLTQEQLAQVLGLSAVHTNRSLMVLRRTGLVSWDDGLISAPDWTALQAYAGFSSDYLHLVKRREVGAGKIS